MCLVFEYVICPIFGGFCCSAYRILLSCRGGCRFIRCVSNSSYESGDGTKAQESGELKKLDEGEGEVVQGDFSYTAPDGQKYVVTYVADENGYQPVGEHIPAIPEAIARSIEWNKAHPEEEEEEAKKL